MAKNDQPKKAKKTPVRQCLGCSEHKPKQELIRIVLSPEGDISLDFTGKKSGRGAYICHDVKCLRKIRKSGRLVKVFEREIPEEIYDELEKELTENE